MTEWTLSEPRTCPLHGLHGPQGPAHWAGLNTDRHCIPISDTPTPAESSVHTAETTGAAR